MFCPHRESTVTTSRQQDFYVHRNRISMYFCDCASSPLPLQLRNKWKCQVLKPDIQCSLVKSGGRFVNVCTLASLSSDERGAGVGVRVRGVSGDRGTDTASQSCLQTHEDSPTSQHPGLRGRIGGVCLYWRRVCVRKREWECVVSPWM